MVRDVWLSLLSRIAVRKGGIVVNPAGPASASRGAAREEQSENRGQPLPGENETIGSLGVDNLRQMRRRPVLIALICPARFAFSAEK
jgi:hypothetical protein